MDKARLLALLNELHAELATADQLDNDTRTAVATIATDAQRLLRQSDAHAEGGDSTTAGFEDDHGSLAQQLRDRLQEFGADHPRLAKALNQVADGLSGLGI